MLPTLLPGREVLINPRAYTQQEPQVGDLVVAAHPQQPGLLIIKRVAAVGEGALDLRGDNPEASTDSRQFGWVSRDRILGQVVCRFLVTHPGNAKGPTALMAGRRSPLQSAATLHQNQSHSPACRGVL
jgi:nickel-type superoxide dismutase maturation protease